MRKLISFCLHGDKDKYCKGFRRNVTLSKKIYPEWEVVLFYDSTVPERWIEKYKRAGVELHDVDGCGLHPTSYRFLACELPEVERIIFRDADSRISEREAEAVREWEESGLGLHAMRDHPNHVNPMYPLFAGMWGVLPSRLDIDIRQSILSYQGPVDPLNIEYKWGVDQHFLRDTIYQKFFNTDSILIHTVCEKRFDFEVDFPSPRNKNKNFVGEIFDFVDGKEERGPQWKEL
jgi:hypothetical protein